MTETRHGHGTAHARTLDRNFTASDYGLVAFNYDPVVCPGGTVLVSGTVYLAKVLIRRTATASNLIVAVSGSGSTLTAGQNLLGLYNSAGTRIALSADQTVAFGSAGTKVAAVTPVALPVGFYWVAVLCVGGTPITVARGTSLTSVAVNLGASTLTAATARFATAGTAQTSLPATITPASNDASDTTAIRVWVGIS